MVSSLLCSSYNTTPLCDVTVDQENFVVKIISQTRPIAEI